MKKLLKYLLLILLVLISIAVFQNYPNSSEAKPLQWLADTVSIRKNLEAIINTPESRSIYHPAVLDSVASYIQAELMAAAKRVTLQEYEVSNVKVRNVIASFGPEEGERIIVGAHYDVCGEQDGADDNASGVAGLLALAKLLQNEPLKYRIDLVAYTLEEPPFFGTEQMGSYVHAKWLYDAKVPVKGMISLEMIGYYSDEEDSQQYPVGFLEWFYGSKANFITIVQNSTDGAFSREFKKRSFKNNSLLTKSFKAPSFFGGIDLSDHRNYWKFGYNAVMVTNTSFYRNHSYHATGDVLPKLNIANIGLVVDGVFRTLKEMQ